MDERRDLAAQIRDEEVSLAFPVLEPFVTFPVCKQCGAKHIKLASWLERKNFIRKDQRLGAFANIYCPGQQGKPAPCEGIPQAHIHTVCTSCQYNWLTVTYQEQKRKDRESQSEAPIWFAILLCLLIFAAVIGMSMVHFVYGWLR